MATLPTPTDWVLGPMAEGRKSALERLLPFEDLARQIASQAVVAPPFVADANNRSAPPRTIRAAFRLQADPETLDIFHNGIAGLRAASIMRVAPLAAGSPEVVRPRVLSKLNVARDGTPKEGGDHAQK